MSHFKELSSSLFHFKEGDVLGGCYTVIGILNRGSYGIVLLAHDSENCQVAIKVLFSQLVSEHKTELEILSSLPPSKHTISYKTSFYENGFLFIVLEYYPCGDLYEAIVSNRLPRDTEAIRSLMLQLIDGISFLHENGVYHRDLKPENILLSRDPENDSILARIGDFGLATTQKTVSDVGTGSNRYMAPEQYDTPVFCSFGGYHYDASKVDIWALGICLLNIIFSKNPFNFPSVSDLVFSDYMRDPISLFDVFPNMSEDTFKVLQCSLVWTPEKRSLEEMRLAVEHVFEWTVDSQYLEETSTEKKLSIFNYENISTIEARKSLSTPSVIVPSTYHESFAWTKAFQSVDVAKKKNTSNGVEDSKFTNIPTSLFHETDRIDVKEEKIDSISSIDSGLGTSIGSCLHSNHSETTYSQEIPKNFSDNSTNIIFPISLKGSKSHLLFGKSWADDDVSSDDEFGTSLFDTSEKPKNDSSEYIGDPIEDLVKKNGDMCLWMLTLEDNMLDD